MGRPPQLSSIQKDILGAACEQYKRTLQIEAAMGKVDRRLKRDAGRKPDEHEARAREKAGRGAYTAKDATDFQNKLLDDLVDANLPDGRIALESEADDQGRVILQGTDLRAETETPERWLRLPLKEQKGKAASNLRAKVNAFGIEFAQREFGVPIKARHVQTCRDYHAEQAKIRAAIMP